MLGTAGAESWLHHRRAFAGKRLANPSAILLSTAEMLRHLGEAAAGAALERAVHGALGDPAARTRDLGGSAGLDRFTESVIERLR